MGSEAQCLASDLSRKYYTSSLSFLCLRSFVCVMGMNMVPPPVVVLVILQDDADQNNRTVGVSYCYYYNFWWAEVLYSPDLKSMRDPISWNQI